MNDADLNVIVMKFGLRILAGAVLLFVGGVIGPAMFRRDSAREEEADDEAETTA